MKTTKLNKSIQAIFVILFMVNLSCTDDDLKQFETIAYVPCEESNAVANPNILNDFECQANVDLDGVETIRNPFEIQINKSRFVGKYTDGIGAWDNILIDYGAPIDFTSHAVFKIKVKSEIRGVLKIKLEGGTSNPIEIDAVMNASPDVHNSWTEYTFDFSNQILEDHSKMILFFNAGVETDGTDVYYIDDLFWDTAINPCKSVSEDLSVLNDFDCQQNYFIGNPDEVTEPTATRILNPEMSGINTSDFVGKYIDDGTNAWDNLYIDLGEEIDLSVKNVLSIKVHSSNAVPLLAKLEGGTASEIWANIEVLNEWVEYTFNFASAVGNGNTKILFFFNAGQTNGTTEDIYYVDDIKFLEDACNGVMPNLDIINDFDCQQNQNVAGNVGASIVDNPNSSGINTSAAVLEITDNGTDAWDHLLFDFGTPIDLSTKNQLNIKIHSSKTVPILAKLEGGTSAPAEIWGDIDTVGEWKEYTFNFSSQVAENHQKIVLFFNGGQTDGTSTDVYYVDDIKFTETVIIPPATFYMPFEGNYTDAVSTADATIVGTPGFAGSGASGIDAYEGAADSYLTFPITGLTSAEFSATMWYKLNSAPDRAAILVIGPEDTGNGGFPDVQNLRTNGFRFFREVSDDNNAEQRFKLNAGNGTGDTWIDGGVNADIPVTGEWVHLAITISSSAASVYINGSLAHQSGFDGIDWTGCDIVSIMSGAPRFTEWGHFSDHSQLDELKFFDVALSLEQIQAIMNQ
ncbi:LamG domain-containing protein [Snuella lapsa]|uniref:Uncharacterized protein n=1 Tax=Snuella lapsa TaxID=870481 RepID=A0ABP6X6I2_9FLAO